MGPFPVLPCHPTIPEGNQLKSAASFTYMDDIYLVVTPQMMPGVTSMLESNLSSICLRLNMKSPGPQEMCMGFSTTKTQVS